MNLPYIFFNVIFALEDFKKAYVSVNILPSNNLEIQINFEMFHLEVEHENKLIYLNMQGSNWLFKVVSWKIPIKFQF